jgi:DNA-binding transcriptional ArsR family regulator
MVKYSDEQLDGIFAALADRTRRKVLASLESGSRPVTELASAHDMSLPGFMKHLRVLEDVGLLERTKEGRVVRCTLQPEPMKEAASWIAHYEKFWTDKLDSLARYLYQQEELQTWKKPASPTSPPSRSRGSTPRRPKGSGARGPMRKR